MPDEKPKKPFALDAQQTAFTMRDIEKVRDQDNARFVPKPPSTFRLDNPRLAPPGMKGIRRTIEMDQNMSVNGQVDQPSKGVHVLQGEKSGIKLGEHNSAKREFKSLTKSENLGRAR